MKYILILLTATFLCTSSSFIDDKEGINWISIEEADQLNNDDPKKIMVFFETSWCGYCKKMDRTIFQNEYVVDIINQNFYAVRFDAESKEPITFDNIDYGFDESVGNRGAHEIATDMLQGYMAYPTVVFLDEDKTLINKLIGQQPEELFTTYLSYLKDDAYLSQDWYEYSGQE